MDLDPARAIDRTGTPRNLPIYIAAHLAPGTLPTLPEQADCYAQQREDARYDLIAHDPNTLRHHSLRVPP